MSVFSLTEYKLRINILTNSCFDDKIVADETVAYATIYLGGDFNAVKNENS